MNFDLIYQNDQFALYQDGQELFSPGGNKVAHPNPRLLKQIVVDEHIRVDSNGLSLLDFLIWQIDHAVFEAQTIDKALMNDPVLNPIDRSMPNPETLINHPELINLIYQNATVISKVLQSFSILPDQDISRFCGEKVSSLSPEQKAAVFLLYDQHQFGISLSILLVSHELSPSEYAASIVVAQIKKGEIESLDQIRTSFQAYLKDAQYASEYSLLGSEDNKVLLIDELIKQGESDQLEFKSTFRWDIRQNKKNQAIEHAALKSMCAFLNSDGGNLLIGVRDDGTIEGIETDGFPNDDRFLLHVWTMIKTCMGEDLAPFIKTSLQKYNDRTVCRVACERCTRPVFLNQKGFDEAFYVRIGPATGKLEISAALKYIEQRF